MPSFEIPISTHLQYGYYQLPDLNIQETIKEEIFGLQLLNEPIGSNELSFSKPLSNRYGEKNHCLGLGGCEAVWTLRTTECHRTSLHQKLLALSYQRRGKGMGCLGGLRD